MRNMSFAFTTGQVRNQTKTVTRRFGWWKDKNGRRLLRAGDSVQPVVKGMGLKKGERVEKIGSPIRIIAISRIPLALLDDTEPAKEGFPKMTAVEFYRMFKQHNNCRGDVIVTRIEFEYTAAIRECEEGKG